MSAQTGYDAIAWVYRRHWGAFSGRRFLPVLERLLLPHLPPHAHILDLGCGTGNVARALTEKGYRVTGVDLAAAMVQQARQVAPQATCVHHDMCTFRQPGAFHAAIAVFATFNHLPDLKAWRACLQNTRRNLKPGGWLLFDFNTPDRLAAQWSGTEVVVEEDMVVIARGAYDPKSQTATTEITAFRPQGALWQRDDAVLRLRGIAEADVRRVLHDVGFAEIAFHPTARPSGEPGRIFALARTPAAGGQPYESR